YEVARRAWRAFREPTPKALDELRQDDTSAFAVSRSSHHSFFPGISVDNRRTLANRASPAGAGERRRDRIVDGVPTDARWRGSLLQWRTTWTTSEKRMPATTLVTSVCSPLGAETS